MQPETQTGITLATFTVDKSASRFTVQAFATGLLSAFGHNPRIEIRGYDAEIRCVPDTLEKASLRLTVRTNSMEVLDEMKRDDRLKLEQEMYQKVLDVTHFPTAFYESRNITVQKVASNLFKADVDGELSFHGMTQPLHIPANITVIGDMLRIAGGFTIRQSDYGIKPVSFAAGTLRLKDELKFTFELVARKDEAASA